MVSAIQLRLQVAILWLSRNALGAVAVGFVALWTCAWYLNANMGTKYDLIQLRETYAFVVGQLLAKYGIDSTLNSERGAKP